MRVHCPRCGNTVTLEAGEGRLSRDGSDDRLRGGERSCTDCGTEFGVYHY